MSESLAQKQRKAAQQIAALKKTIRETEVNLVRMRAVLAALDRQLAASKAKHRGH